jgi:outer membrane protein
MKRWTFLLAALFVAAGVSAKELRIGVINSEQILANYQEYSASMRILQEEKADWDRQISNREAEIEAEMRAYRQQENALSPVTRSERRAEIDRRIAELEEFKGEIYLEGSGRFFRRNQELMEPLITRVNEAIRTVAEEEGYDLILDNSVPVVVFVAEDRIDVNLNEKVIAKLQGDQ